MALYLQYRQATALPVDVPLAFWESPYCLVFSSAQQLTAAADAQGLAEMFHSGPQALFPGCQPGVSHLTADDEELIWELACEQTDGPENAMAWPAGYGLLCFLTFWRSALMDNDAFLELSEEPNDATAYLLASPANAGRLRLAYEQFDRGERIDFIPPAE